MHVEYQINEAKGIYYVNDFRIICRKICDKLMSNAIMHNLNKFNYESMYSDILNALMLFDNAEELATITGLRVDNNGKLLVLPCENMALLRESGSIRLSHISAIIPGSRLFYEFLVTDCYNCKNLIYKHAANSKKFKFFETIYNIYNNILPFLNYSSKKELIKRIAKTDIKHAIKLLNSKQNTKTLEKTKKLASKIAKMPDIVQLNCDIAKTMLALQKADNSVIEQLVHMEIFLQKYCNRYDFCTILKRYVNTKMSDDELINKTIEILVQYYNAQEFSRTDIEDFQKYEGEVSFDMLYSCLDTFINKYHYPKNTKEYMATAIREFLEEIDAQNKLV